jgi:hydroxyacylglutathione hydrolase
LRFNDGCYWLKLTVTVTLSMIIPIPLRISYAFLIESKRPVLVDTGMPGEEQLIVEAMAKVGYSAHAHIDHAGSTAALQHLSKAPCLVQKEDAADLAAGVNTVPPPDSLMGWLIQRFLIKPYPSVVADIVVEEKLDMHVFGVAAQIIHTPGHTPGSCSVVFDSGEAIVGDLLMGGYLGGHLFAGKPGYHYFVNSKDDLHRSIRKLLDMNVHTFYTGHGGPLQRERVEKWWGNLR